MIENEPSLDPFDELWSLLPKRHGNKKTTKARFRALSEAERERCLTAARNLHTYVEAGGSLEFIPLSENFIGGQKARYTMWVNGPPPRYAARPRSRDISSAEFNDLAAAMERGEMEVIDQ